MFLPLLHVIGEHPSGTQVFTNTTSNNPTFVHLRGEIIACKMVFFCNPGYNFTELLCDPTVKLLYFNSINIALRLLELMSKYTDVFYIEGIVGLLYLTISCPLNMLQAKMIESFWIGISCRCLCVNWKRERRTCCGISSSLYCIIFLGTKSAE